MHIFRELREIRLGLIQAAAFGEALEPEILIELHVPAVAAYDAFPQHTAGQFIVKVRLERLQVTHGKARRTGDFLERHAATLSLDPQVPSKPYLVLCGNLHCRLTLHLRC